MRPNYRNSNEIYPKWLEGIVCGISVHMSALEENSNKER